MPAGDFSLPVGDEEEDMAKKKVPIERSKEEPSKGGVIYTCRTCGKVAKTRAHLCSPAKAPQLYVCAYCGRSSGDPYHVCKPMAAEMKYVCTNCGRVTPYRGAVCQPRLIR